MPKYINHSAEITVRITELAELPGNSLQKLLSFKTDLNAILFKCQAVHLEAELKGNDIKYYSFKELDTKFATHLTSREFKKLKRDFWKFVDTPTCSLMNQRSVVGTRKLAGGKYSTKNVETCYSHYIEPFWQWAVIITRKSIKKIEDAKAQKAELELRKEVNVGKFEVARDNHYSQKYVEVTK